MLLLLGLLLLLVGSSLIVGERGRLVAGFCVLQVLFVLLCEFGAETRVDLLARVIVVIVATAQRGLLGHLTIGVVILFLLMLVIVEGHIVLLLLQLKRLLLLLLILLSAVLWRN